MVLFSDSIVLLVIISLELSTSWLIIPSDKLTVSFRIFENFFEIRELLSLNHCFFL